MAAVQNNIISFIAGRAIISPIIARLTFSLCNKMLIALFTKVLGMILSQQEGHLYK